jgi:hypothetical protein
LIYSFDTSSILHAWRRAYPPEVFPAIWQRLDGLIQQGQLIASEEVLVELEQKDDEVHGWARQRRAMFVPQETPTANPAQPKIPDVCRALGIGHINVLQLIRQQGWVF